MEHRAPSWADYWKLHGLGNDYLVLAPGRFRPALTPEAIRQLCCRHTGLGSDGLLLGPLRGALRPASQGPQASLAAQSPEAASSEAGGGLDVRIFNPDGSEAEKSGNGLRIFARHAWEHGLAPRERPFFIHTLGGRVQAQALDARGGRFRVQMGRARFCGGAAAPLVEALAVCGQTLQVCAVELGNPHCVVPCCQISARLALGLGAALEQHARFPQGTNVQFLRIVEAHTIAIEIWERGAGRTLASGSSSCAAAAVAVGLGWCRSPLRVLMPGGELQVQVDAEFRLQQEGAVESITQGRLSAQLLSRLGLQRNPGQHGAQP